MNRAEPPSSPLHGDATAERTPPPVVGSKSTAAWQQEAPPPGLIGEVANYIYSQAPYPNVKIALAGAISLLAGITGRAYNVSGVGLNQYTLILGMTAIGKEAAGKGISRLQAAIAKTVPASADFIGPSHIASIQALHKRLARTPACLCIIGEAGLKLSALLNPRAAPADAHPRARAQATALSGPRR